MSRIAITPSDRFWRFVVVADVPTNLPREVCDGGEDAARQEVTFDLRKPQLDLIEPGRIGWREVHVDVRMLQQKRAHGLGFVGRKVVGDHVNLPALRLRGDDVAEERDERGAGVARDGLAEYFTGFRVERREERERAVTEIFESMTLGPTR